MKYFVAVTFSFLFLFLAQPAFMAQAPCTTVFGGGQQEDGASFCLEQVQATQTTPTQSPGFKTANDTMTQNQPQTKGGQYPAPAVQRQPNTGPELFGVIALIPAAYTGWKLRKTTRR
jgi:hypothetical protein